MECIKSWKIELISKEIIDIVNLETVKIILSCN